MTKRNEQLTMLVRQGDEQTCLAIINSLSNREKFNLLEERNTSYADELSQAEVMIPANNLIRLAIEKNMQNLANVLITVADPVSFKNPDSANVGLLDEAAAKGMHEICKKLIPLLSDRCINSAYSKDFLALKHAINNKWEDVCLLLVPKTTKECLVAMKEDQNHNLMNEALKNHMKDTYYTLENLMHHYGLNTFDELLPLISINEDYW